MPRLRTPALVNAAEYWLRPERFARRCQPPRRPLSRPRCPDWRPWLCLTHPDDIKRVFTADTDVLRLGAALAKGSPHPLVLGPTGLTNVDGAEHMRSRRMQLPPFHGRALAEHQEVMERKTEETLERWPYGRPTRADAHMQAISLEVIIAVVFGVTDPDRVERLRAATQALMREGNSRRFFVQTMIVTARNKGWDGPFPRMRRAMAAVDAIVLEEVAERRRMRTTSTRTTCSGCSCAPATRTGCRCPTASSATRCARCCSAATRPPPPRSPGSSSASAATPTNSAPAEAAALDGDDDYIDAVIKESDAPAPRVPDHRAPRV